MQMKKDTSEGHERLVREFDAVDGVDGHGGEKDEL